MNLYETTGERKAFLSCNEESANLRGLVRRKRLLRIVSVHVIILLASQAATFAQTPSRGDRAPRPVPSRTVQPDPPPTSEPIILGTSAQTVEIPGKLKVGNGRMEVVTSAIGGGVLTSNLYIRQLNQSGSPAHLCWKVAPDGVPGLLLTPCTTSQSSLRYKTDLRPFLGGFNVINRLVPYNFAWKTGGIRELGLVAEDVAQIEPLLTFKNSKGEIEGVKYENLNVVFINAFKEQQRQIEELREQLKQQAQQIDSLRKIVSP